MDGYDYFVSSFWKNGVSGAGADGENLKPQSVSLTSSLLAETFTTATKVIVSLASVVSVWIPADILDLLLIRQDNHGYRKRSILCCFRVHMNSTSFIVSLTVPSYHPHPPIPFCRRCHIRLRQ
jgi:hypothetical protein